MQEQRKYRVLVVDDEPLARGRLRDLLSAEPRVEVVGECGDGASAIEAIRSEKPDLVFLDVQMPEFDGFEVIQHLGPNEAPAVIFVTAHDKFALRAFEIHAVDYLLKPFDKERFQKALTRALSQLSPKIEGGDQSRGFQNLLEELRGKERPPERLVIKSEGRVLLIKMDDVDYVEAADNYVEVHVGPDSHLLRQTMANLETRLPASKFIRISRSSIVNMDRIKELQPLFHGEYVVILKNGVKLTLSRGYREKVDQILGLFS